MFTPIKNLITYIQKNANFGSNSSAIEETAKMETSDQLKLQSECIEDTIDTKRDTTTPPPPVDAPCEDNSTNVTTKNPPTDKKDSSQPVRATTTCSPSAASKSSTPLRTSPRKSVALPSTCVFEDDDIEAQIESSIMLKKPVKDATSKGTEILEVKKSPDRSIFITHDYNRNHAATPIEDELEDFRHDPTEVVTSSPLSNAATNLEDNCLVAVDSADEAKHDGSDDDNATECIHINLEEEECEERNKDRTEDGRDALELCESHQAEENAEKVILVDSEMEDDVEEVEEEVAEVHSLSSISAEEDEDDVEETFLDMDNFPDSEVIVISEDIRETSSGLNVDSIDAANTSDDPLAIACEEQEAFAADKIAALQELNLLNTSAHSQDEDTATTTTEDDLLWLRTTSDATQRDEEQPSCSKSPAKIQSQSGTTPEKDERNGEGSDSGLGSETSALHTTNTSIADTSQLNMTPTVTTNHSQSPSGKIRKNSDKDSGLLQSPLKEPPKPLRSNLKRRLEVDDDVVDTLRTITSSASSTTTTSSLSVNHQALSGSLNKKPKRSINFDNVQVYYFPRQQGFSCVPSAGGCTLGMGARHVGFKTLTLAEHAAELRRAHRMQLQEINPRGSSSDDSEESEEDYLSEGSGSDLDGESNGFLQPVSPKQRRTILKAAGIRKIDASEKAECRDIRNSREVCGCSCRDFCDPETCACSQSGIKCQVDRDMFPCGCSRDACGNTIGRVEFNPARVRTHFIHTLMRLEMENRQQQNPYSPAAIPTATPTSAAYYQSHLQPQSNYSSGYASPAYNASAEMHPQTAANTFYHQQQTPPSASSLYGQEMSLSGGSSASTSSAVAAATPYGLDTLDSGLFSGAGVGATPSYGELMPVPSYHHHNMNFGNVQTQVAAGYNSYHSNSSTSYLNANTTTLNNNTPTSYSSCAVPSILPYGTATTTEASGVYHSVDSLATTLETTTAPSCTKQTDTDVGTSFISLSTPLASSSRLSQINDLLQHNRNATTALVAVTQTIGCSTASAPVACTTVAHLNGGAGSGTYNTTSINTPPIEDAHKTCMAYGDLTAPPPLKPAPIVAVVVNDDRGPVKLPAPPPLQPSLSSLTSEMSLTSTPTIRTATPMIDLTTTNTEFLPQPHEEKTDTAVAAAATTMPVIAAAAAAAAVVPTAEVSAMEVVAVAAGN